MERDSNPRHYKNAPVFKTGTLNHSDIHPILDRAGPQARAVFIGPRRSRGCTNFLPVRLVLYRALDIVTVAESRLTWGGPRGAQFCRPALAKKLSRFARANLRNNRSVSFSPWRPPSNFQFSVERGTISYAQKRLF